jgi:hypothetical protein
VDASGTRYVSFSLSPPPAGWPLGKYEVQLLLDDKEEARLPFSVSEDGATWSVSAAAPEASRGAYKRMTESALGFSFEMPADWSWELTSRKDYRIGGPKGGDAFEIAVTIQAVPKPSGRSGALSDQVEQAQKLLIQAPEAKLQKRGVTMIAGREAPFLIARHQSRDSRAQSAEFATSQAVVETDRYYLWISYTAPISVYMKFLPAFQRLANTFEIKG